MQNSDNVQLNNYKDLFNNKIIIQNCEDEQILDSFFYGETEDELAEFILPKLWCFKQEFRKIVYQYECFIGERSSLIYHFLEKYKQRELTQIEFYAVVSYILKNKNNNKTILKNFLLSLQVLIGIILEESPKFNETLYSILEREDKMSYKKRDIYLTIDCLINLFEIVELFCWENNLNNLSKKYLDDIDDKIKSQFNSIFNIKKEAKNYSLMITKNEFCSAIRKFISLYLSGRNEDYINQKNLLKSIHISQSLKLYDYLGGDEEKLENIKNKYIQFKEK